MLQFFCGTAKIWGDLATNCGKLRQIAANCGKLAIICCVGLIFAVILGEAQTLPPLFWAS
jgi:hypothetical protein